MKILLTIKEYAKLKGLSEIGARNRLSANHTEIIKINKISYAVQDDNVVEKLKQTIKNKNSQIRELKLKLEVKIEQKQDKYLKEIEKQNKKMEKQLKQERKDNKKLHQNIFATLANQNKQLN